MTIVVRERPRIAAAMLLMTSVLRDELLTQPIDSSALGARVEAAVIEHTKAILAEMGADAR